MPLLPWVEANQGLLSLLALAAALGIALFEFYRAERSSRNLLDNEVRAAVWPINDLLKSQLEASEALDKGEAAANIRRRWNVRVDDCLSALEVVRSRTLVPLLAVQLHVVSGRVTRLRLGPDDVDRQTIGRFRVALITDRMTLEIVAKGNAFIDQVQLKRRKRNRGKK